MSILESTRKMTTNEKICYDMGYAQGKQDAAPVVRGEWINAGHDAFTQYRRCSSCARLLANAPAYDYCPNCGAKMGGEDE